MDRLSVVFRTLLPSFVRSSTYPVPIFVHVNIPSGVVCGFASHTTLGAAVPPRVVVNPFASVVTLKVAPENLSEE